MKEYLQTISKCSLFNNIKSDEILNALQCLNSYIKDYKSNEIIIHIGEPIKKIAMVLSGTVYIEKIDILGNNNILSNVNKSEIFGETYAIAKNSPSEVEAIAGNDVKILYMDVSKIIDTCSNNCKFHNQIIKNLLIIMSQKNLILNRKINHITRKTTREKIMSFLAEQAREVDSTEFVIPYNRQQLADYLNVDRSAMSNELSKLRQDGIIEYKKNMFKLKI